MIGRKMLGQKKKRPLFLICRFFEFSAVFAVKYCLVRVVRPVRGSTAKSFPHPRISCMLYP